MLTFNFFPIPFAIGLLLLAGVGIRRRAQGWLYLFGLALFGLYLLAVLGLVFFPIPLRDDWPAGLNWKDTLIALRSVNLIPFNYRLTAGFPGELRFLLIEIVRNILLTIPFGFGAAFMAQITGQPLRGRRLLWIALAAGLTMEGLQLLLKLITGSFFRAVDVNDVILNALGALIGAGLFEASAWVMKRIRR